MNYNADNVVTRLAGREGWLEGKEKKGFNVFRIFFSLKNNFANVFIFYLAFFLFNGL